MSAPNPTSPRPSGPESFRALYRAEFSYVWNTLIRLGVRGADLEDFTHDVFATAYRRWDSYDSRRPLRPWLFGIAYRVVSDFRRKLQNQRETVESDPDAVDGTANAEEALASRQGMELALGIIQKLELDRRAVFIMFELDGCPMSEVAETMAIPVNTAYSRLRLARQDFNDAVKRLHAREAAR